MNVPIPRERVLPTLNADGTRNRIRPRLYPGRIHTRRRLLGWALIVLFVGLPFLRIGGQPAVLLDVMERRFHLFGRTFLATDGVLLMLLMLSIFATVIWTTALVGRAWCGWGCPQTVYMEFLFRPIERLFEGKREPQIQIDQRGMSPRRVAKNGVFLLLAAVLGNVFLSYFVGVHTLIKWVTEPPALHWGGFLVMGVTTGLVFFDFAYFREQMCTIICPYARLQSVLLDRRSLIIGYDTPRGEPRSKGKARPGNGDCIDCQACVVACPTGIDIRDGLQLDCIACGQCVDACDTIMGKIHKPVGLIRYASQDSLQTGQPNRFFRPRVAIYTGLLLVLFSALAFVGRKPQADVTILRGIGAPFSENAGNSVNQIRIKVQNRADSARAYRLELLAPAGALLIAPENPLRVLGGEQATTSVFISLPSTDFKAGRLQAQFRVSDGHGFVANIPYELLGPQGTR
ncbi:MAG: cytochrome c oxidase accessory protein CcoG [Polyangiaceae bacterium]